MKTCSTCGREKPLEEFNRKSASKDGRTARCKFCQREKTREHYENNKKYYIDKARKNSAKYKIDAVQYVCSYLLRNPCLVCGETDIRVLDFHHDKKDKSFNVSSNVGNGVSFEKLVAEIDKCVVLCRNCHARHHAVEDNTYRHVWLVENNITYE